MRQTTRGRRRLVGRLLFSVGAALACFAGAAYAAGQAVSPPPPLNTHGKKGGTITVLLASDIDSLDPGTTYFAVGYEVAYATQRPLLGYRANSTRLVPDLAASMPVVSRDGRTVTVRLREGVHFGPPVNREVTSADVKYAVERGFARSVSNGYAWTYFGVIQGAPEAPLARPRPIAGIRTPDAHTLVFRLTRPSGVFVAALSMPITAPVPKEYAAKLDLRPTSGYGQRVVATGPYMVRNDASGSVRPGYSAGQSITLVRNPNWDPSTDYRPAYADKVVFKEGATDGTIMTRQILAGTADANGDSPPPAAELRSILASPEKRRLLFFTPTSGSRYVALNTARKPFDNLWVRRAIAYVLDRRAMLLTRGGPIVGTIATHFIDPSFAGLGFEAAGGYAFDPFPSPGHTGNVARAKAMLKRAGYPTGLYTGPSVTMVAVSTQPDANTARVVAADLAKIGIRVKTVSVSGEVMYSRFCSVPRNAPEICPNVGWMQDFKEPQTLLDVPFDGNSILPANSSNWPQLNDPAINRAMAAAERILDPKKRYAAWGRIDRMITLTAAAIPWEWENWPSLFSPRVVPALMSWNAGAPDVAWMSVR